MAQSATQKQETKNVPNIGKEWAIEYKASGVDIRLTPGIVRKFLVRGKGEITNDQEVVFFMKTCQARGLNPFIGDAYIIKYGNDPAAIVTSIDFYRKRARAQKDCSGWKRGIIVEDDKGNIRDSFGLLRENEKLIGGFFEAQPEGWKVPFRIEVNLSGYLRYRKDRDTGESILTKFWEPENQPTMIAKVAEAQGLRTLWPDEFKGLYSAEELPVEEDLSKGAIDVGLSDIPSLKNFDELVQGRNTTGLDQFLEMTAKAQRKPEERTVEAVKVAAAKEFDTFWATFEKWQKRQQPKNGNGNKQQDVFVDCPASPGEQRARAYCDDKCKSRQGCPAWDEDAN